MTAKFSPKRYADLLADTLPQIIETDAEHERLLVIIEPMMGRGESFSPEERKLFSLLVKLIQDYEDSRYPIEPATPDQMLRHLMEARDLQQKDIVHLFGGSAGRASEAINGVREISKAQAKALAEFFHVSPELFI